ncbi:MAG: sulfotransferase domain-containing protein [Deltaproteobacteria bacterium]|nr:MAG: sulfotransferase domain-containing protein [Deltaproteobacteria bacterium]
MIPNFLIVGAAKSGTTSLYEYLRQHPDIFMPQWKELSFFCGDQYGPLHKVKKPQYYDRVFAKAQNQSAVGEASTSYLFDEAAPRRIKEGLGTIKILIVLRDPVTMSYSLYNHQVRKEGETIKSFELALAAEAGRHSNPEFKKKCYGWHANYYYYRRGLYYPQVKRYLDTFGRNNVLILLFEELANDAVAVAQKVYKFLDVDDTLVPMIKVHNPAGGILRIPRFWEDTGLFLKTFQFVISKNLVKKIPHLLRNIGRKPPSPINPTTAQILRERFYDDICRLEKLINKDLSAWKE